jgi:hypothetical protein
MDFQLAQKKAPSYLRDILAFESTWWYKGAIIINPILRMTWVFFVIFDPNIQHSNIVSFAVALVEVFRRGLWVIFRVENEHCANIARDKASRDTPPYSPQHSSTGVKAAQDPPQISHTHTRHAHIISEI